MAKRKAVKKPQKAAKPARRPSWFDETTQMPLIQDYARQLKSFLQAMADGTVDKKELKAQEARLVELMKEIEPKLNDSLHAKVTRLLCELTAYDIMQIMHTMQQARPTTQFRG